MTYQEVLALLNDLTSESPKHFRNIGVSLEPAEEVVVCDYISDFEAQDEKFDIWGRLPAIISIANNYPKMPSVIKQVLFYTGVACKINKMASLEELHKFIESNGLNISHNFFSKIGVSAYVDMLLYRQPKMLFNYAGQKHGELGAALKHLIYQAGSYDVFVDIFGGSGAAFVAFPRRRNAVYVYNDLDKDLANLIEVIAGEKQHLVLIDYLTKLQEDLKGERRWEDFVFNNNREVNDFYKKREANDFYKKREANDFYKKREANDFYKKRKSCKTPSELRVIFDNKAHIRLDNDVIMKEMEKLYKHISENSEIPQGSSGFIDTVFGSYLKTNNRYDLLLSYILNYKDIFDYINTHNVTTELSKVVKDCRGKKEEVDILDNQNRANQLRFYEWWAIFSNVRDNEANYDVDDVFKGVATIYLNYFLTNGQTGISPILRIYLYLYEIHYGGKKQDNQWKKFIEEDFKTIIEKLYSLIKKNDKLLSKRKSSSNRSLTQRTWAKNMDCIKLIDKYKSNGVAEIKHEKPLFYSDSPYIGTRGYPAGDFTSNNMKALIEKLAQTKDRFIFSCRACIGSSAGSKISRKLKAGNQKILDDVFGNFKTNFNTDELYVLTIAKVKTVSKKDKNGKKINEVKKADFWKDKEGNNIEVIKGDFLRDENGEKIQVMEGDFWERVIQNKITEIMITNYPIYDFKDAEYEFTYFKVVSFEDFMLMLKNTINL